MKIYYKKRNPDTRKLSILHSLKDDELHDVPEIGETICAKVYKVEDIIKNLVNNTITIILV